MRTKPRTSVKPIVKERTLSAKESRLAAQMQRTFDLFLEHHPPRRLSTNLRRMLLEFLMSEGGVEAEYLQNLLYDLDGLFVLLENVDEIEG